MAPSGVAQPVLDTVGRALGQGEPPAFEGPPEVVRVQRRGPALAGGLARLLPGVLGPAAVMELVVPVRPRDEHRLRHGIHQGAEFRFAVRQR